MDPTRTPADGRSGAGRNIDAGAIALAVGAWLAFSLGAARLVVPVYLHDPNYSHGLLLPALAFLLAWRTWAQLAVAADGVRWPGFVVLAAGAGLTVVGHWCHAALQLGWRGHVFLQAVGWLAATAGGVWILLGWPRFRILAPRLGFLVFVVPLPDRWLLAFSLALQRGVAICSTGLLRILGTVVCREGDLLHFASVTLGVAGACSGIRSLMAFFAAAAVCAVFFDLGAKRALLLLALAPVVAVGTNVLRVVVTSLLVIRWGRVWIEGAWHGALGLAVVLLGGILLFAAARGLRRTGVPAEGGSARKMSRFRLPPFLRSAALAATAVFLVAALGQALVTRHYARMAQSVRIRPVERRPLREFPRRIGDYRLSEDFPLAPIEAEMLRPSDHLIRTYVDGAGNRMRLTVLYWNPRPNKPEAAGPPHVPHSPNLCWRYEGWNLVRSEMPASPGWTSAVRLETSWFEKSGQKRLVLFWRSAETGNLGRFAPSELRKDLETLVRSWREVPEGWVAPRFQVRIDTDVDGRADSALSRALEFGRRIAGVLPDYGIGRRSEPRPPEEPSECA